jgi:predicted component of type VI protein secretion system
VHVTRPTDPDGRAWTWSERQEAMRRESLSKRLGKNAKAAPEAEAWLTTAKFNASVASTPRKYFAECDDDLAASIASTRILQQQIDQYFGANAPSLTKIIDLQADIRHWLGTILSQRTPDAPPAVKAPEPAPVAPPPPPAPITPSTLGAVMQQTQQPSAPVSPNDQIAARTDAYRKLAEAADTLLRIEPHSPTPYLVRRAIAWGGMSLAELMRHFMESGYDLKSLSSMLGMDEEPDA